VKNQTETAAATTFFNIKYCDQLITFWFDFCFEKYRPTVIVWVASVRVTVIYNSDCCTYKV